MNDSKQLYDERIQIIDEAIALKQPKRVPNCARVYTYPLYEYKVTLADAFRDYDLATEAYVRYHREFAPDVAGNIGSIVPAKAMEITGVKCARWPGDAKGLDVNSPYQFVEYETLFEEEWDEFLNDTAGFCIRKYLPRQLEVFEPLSKLNWLGMCGGSWNAPIANFTSPPMVEFYKKMLAAAEEMNKFQGAVGKCINTITEMGFPLIYGVVSSMAFDMIVDGLRGTFGMTDLYEWPDKLKAACEMLVETHIQNTLAAARRSGQKYVWVMLHKGSEEFIGNKHFEEFYWPYLRKWIHAMVDNGLVPIVFCEGIYTARLPYLTEVPRGKVVYYFEQVDLKEAKRVLGDIACIKGGFPYIVLQTGTPEEVKEEVKRVLDIAAPGGGYLFCTSCAIDVAPRANMEAMFEAVELYGKY